MRYICCGSALLNCLSLRQYQVLTGVTVYLAPPPHHPGSLSPGGKITRGILPPTRGSFPLHPHPNTHTPRKTSQTQFKIIFIFYNKFIMLNYQNSTNVCFSIFFSFCIKSCQVFWGGGQAPQARVSSSPRGGDKLPRVRGIPRGIFTPEGRQTAQRQLHSPCGEGGRGKLPRIQDKPVHRFCMLICTHFSLIHARVHVYFYILVLRKG